MGSAAAVGKKGRVTGSAVPAGASLARRHEKRGGGGAIRVLGIRFEKRRVTGSAAPAGAPLARRQERRGGEIDFRKVVREGFFLYRLSCCRDSGDLVFA